MNSIEKLKAISGELQNSKEMQSKDKLEDLKIQIIKMSRLMSETKRLLGTKTKLLNGPSWKRGSDETVVDLDTVLEIYQIDPKKSYVQQESIVLRGPSWSYMKDVYNAKVNKYYFDISKDVFIIEESVADQIKVMEHSSDEPLLEHLLLQIAKRKVNYTHGKSWSQQSGLRCDHGECHRKFGYGTLESGRKYFYIKNPKKELHYDDPEFVWVCDYCEGVLAKA